MMGRIALYTGGSRSGKSFAAVQRAASSTGRVCFVATCVPQDAEMRERVKRHQQERPAHWQLIEEPFTLAHTLESIDPLDCPVVVVDCLSLWISNWVCRPDGPMRDEDEAARESEKLAAAAREYGGDVIFVTNEVGLGIIPQNDMARRYVDLVGRCNQVMAAEADEVIFFTSGLGLTLKGGTHAST